ncbi:MAG: DUF4430 domain-containing protein [Defluviitaleaceae bacterium]|nr:DUF4430 domain-containing protein [Defluviitaleaceae bacterium]
MKKHKSKFAAGGVVLALLLVGWFWGGMPQINHPTPAAHETTTVDAGWGLVPALPASAESHILTDHMGSGESPSHHSIEPHETECKPKEYIDEPDPAEPESNTFDTIPEVAGYGRFAQTPEGVIVPDVAPEDIQIFAADHPEMRQPVEPEDMVSGEGSFYVTLSVRAHTILYNMHLLDRDKHELVPEDGWIFMPTQVIAHEGESVFNVLQREMRRHRIHMVSRWTPIFNSAYVEAINNLYEFDVGPLSGWMYSVNGWFPNFGASRYLLSEGDVIEWLYTVDLGRDLGVYWMGSSDE